MTPSHSTAALRRSSTLLVLLSAACACSSSETPAEFGSALQLESVAIAPGWSGTALGGSSDGGATFDRDRFRVVSAGFDFWGPSDDGYLVYHPIEGDFSLSATIRDYAGLPSAPHGKALLVFKEAGPDGLEPDAAAAGVMLAVTRGTDDFFYARRERGAGVGDFSVAALNAVDGSVRVRLQRTGDRFEAFRDDGGSWVRWGAIDLPLDAVGFVGVAASSGTGTPMGVSFEDVALTEDGGHADETGPAIDPVVAFPSDVFASIEVVTDEPAWVNVEFGPTGAYGAVVTDVLMSTRHTSVLTGLNPGVTYHYRVSAWDAWGNATTSSDRTLTTTAGATPGPVVLDAAVSELGARQATIAVRTQAPVRASAAWGAPLTGVAGIDRGTDASTELTREVRIPVDRLLSGRRHEVTVRLEDPAGRSATVPLEFETATAGGAELPAGWTSSDIGAVSAELPGRTVWDPETRAFAVQATGTDVFFASDSFHFVRRPVSGDFRLTLRIVDYAGYLQHWTKGVLMFRADVAADAAMVTQSVNFDDFDYFYFRPDAGAMHTEVGFVDTQVEAGDPVWMRLERRANRFVVSYSSDGRDWTPVHSGVDVPLPTSGMVGFGVCGKSNLQLSEVVFTDVVLENCGDGYVEGDEQCDDGNDEPGDGCDVDCILEGEPDGGDGDAGDGGTGDADVDDADAGGDVDDADTPDTEVSDTSEPDARDADGAGHDTPDTGPDSDPDTDSEDADADAGTGDAPDTDDVDAGETDAPDTDDADVAAIDTVTDETDTGDTVTDETDTGDTGSAADGGPIADATTNPAGARRSRGCTSAGDRHPGTLWAWLVVGLALARRRNASRQ